MEVVINPRETTVLVYLDLVCIQLRESWRRNFPNLAPSKSSRLYWTERLEEAEDSVLFTMNPWMMLKLLKRLCAIPKLMEDASVLTIP